jgi:hypothetical protein
MFTDTTTNILYIGGTYDPSFPISGFAGWTGTNWDTTIYKNPIGDQVNHVQCITKYNGEIYVGGKLGKLQKWNGVNWVTIALNSIAGVICLNVISNELYAGGVFDSIGGLAAHCLAKWDGNIWKTLNFPQLDATPYIFSIKSYRGELYVGGNFYNPVLYPNDTVQNIIRFDGINWKSVGGGMHGGMDEVASMVVYKDELYVAGTFTKAHGNVGNYIQKWDGENWSEVGGGVMGTGGFGNGQIKQLIVCNDKLYAAGVFQYAGGVPAQYIAVWDGVKWCGLGSTFSNILNSLGVLNDMLYIGGGFGVIDGLAVSHIAKWTGGSYVDTCSTPSGVEEIGNLEDGLTIYPNPTTDDLSIVFETKNNEDIQISILNVLGQNVYNELMQTYSGINVKKINIANFSSGIYIINVNTKEGNISKKLIKK